WKQNLKILFIHSHRMLPYPQNNSFMRKSKESKQVLWWSSVHQDLHLHERERDCPQSTGLGLPARYISCYPTDGSNPRLSYRYYTIETEQHLLQLSNTDLYQHLCDLNTPSSRQTPTIRVSAIPPARPMYEAPEINDNPWDPFPQGPIETWSTNTCARKLRQLLSEYELLHHHQQIIQRRPRSLHNSIESTPGPQPGEDLADITSDDESITSLRTRCISLIQQVEKQ
ncbi:hypothetical protein FE257_007284, partial [Aspergillus nanangensis]